MTLAHEYNHILQFGYDAFQDAWFAESTATWMEDQVYPHIDDYLRYVRRWVKRWDTPLTTSSIKEYGSAVWNMWLEHRYGDSIVRHAWARAIHVRPGGFSVNAYESAIRADGRSDFGHDFARFAAAVPEWRTGRVFREGWLYPDVPRQGRLRLDGQPLTRSLNHTTFALLRVRADGGRGSRGPGDGAAGDRRRPGPGRARSAANATATPSPASTTAAAAASSRSASATPVASAASPPWSSTPTPPPTASAPAGSTGAT